MTHRLGQIGLGTLGRIFAGHLLKSNGRLVVYDRNQDCMDRAAKLGATPAASPRDVAEQSTIVVFALPSPDVVKNVMLGDDGILAGAAAGTLILDLSTGDPWTCNAMYRASQERGVHYLEAPVSGGEPKGAGTEGARAANITFMVGGDEEVFERAKPILGILGKHWFHLGPAGNGSVVKLISNLISGLNNLVAAEGFALGVAAGIPWEKMLEVFYHTDAKSYQMTDYMEPRLRRGDFEPGFSVDLMYKDHRLAGELAQRLQVPVLFNQLALQVYQMLRAHGKGSRDFADAINLMAGWANLDINKPRETLF